MAITAEARLLDPLDWLAFAADHGDEPDIAWDIADARLKAIGADSSGLVANHDRVRP